MTYPLYLLVLAIAPGLIWLFYFLAKDAHPEPKRMILKIFLLGMMVAPLAAFLECLPLRFNEDGKLGCFLSSFFSEYFLHPFDTLLYFIVGVALIEEFAKYLIVRLKILKHRELDEPIDVMLYMIIAALGFATLENIFIFFSPDIFTYTFEETLSLANFRLITATFLHALCSGTIGFFMALSFCEIKWRRLLFLLGFALATLLHGLYNFSIMELEGMARFGTIFVILTGLAIFNYFSIKKLKKIKSVCKI